MLATFQNEWDEVMLEVFTLKQHLDSTRRELSQAMYQHDAACRVIARLMKERDEARSMLTSGQGQVAVAHSRNGGASGGMDIVDDTSTDTVNAHKDTSWTANLARISEKSLELQEGRKQRPKKIPEATRAKDSFANLENTATATPHKASPAGVTCVAVQGTTILSGGADKDLHLVSSSSGKGMAKIADAHSKKVSCVCFHKENMLLSASTDQTVKLWKPSKSGYSQAAVFEHDAAVTALCQHPLSQLACSFGADGSFSCLDMERQVASLRISEKNCAEYGYLCGAVHPDAIMLAGGTDGGALKVWDVRQATVAVNLTDHSGRGVTAVDFSNNGYYVCTGDASGELRLWDLRKIKCLHSQTVSTSEVSSIKFDDYGLYAAVGGCGDGSSVQLWQVKDWEMIANLEKMHKKAVTGVAWGANAGFVVSSSLDRCVKVFT
jgi:pre-mRNA-processing factor 19